MMPYLGRCASAVATPLFKVLTVDAEEKEFSVETSPSHVRASHIIENLRKDLKVSGLKPKFKYPANPMVLQSAKHQQKIQRLID